MKSDMVIGVVDTRIWPEHLNFQDHGLSPILKRWKGVCMKGTKFFTSNCNQKLIGVRFFFKGYEAANGKIMKHKSSNLQKIQMVMEHTLPQQYVIMIVGASSLDRSFLAIVKLGNGQKFEGSSLYVSKGKNQLLLVYGKTVGRERAKDCIADSLNLKLV
ncbi:hypothetical protein DITRI_Ditri13aG0028700 [Diplodiscus trichospermus]